MYIWHILTYTQINRNIKRVYKKKFLAFSKSWDMTILGQGGHFVDFSFFALNISETSNKHSDKFFSTFEVDKMSKPNFSRACIFFARCNSMAFAKVPSKDWPLSRKKKNQKIRGPTFGGSISANTGPIFLKLHQIEGTYIPFRKV